MVQDENSEVFHQWVRILNRREGKEGENSDWVSRNRRGRKKRIAKL